MATKKSKSLTKREIQRLKAGTWIVLKWSDHPNSVALITAAPFDSVNPDMLVPCMCINPHNPKRGLDSCNVPRDRVVGVLGSLEFPSLPPDAT